MPRASLVGFLGLTLCWAGLAFGQDPPPLEGPAVETEPAKPAPPPPKPRATSPPATTPAPATRANRRAAPGSQVRPMLVIPGVTSPAARPPVTSRPTGASGAAASESRRTPSSAAPPQGRSPFVQTPGQPASRDQNARLPEPIPMTIEPLDDEPGQNGRPGAPSSGRTTQDRSRTGGSRPAQKPRSTDSDSVSVEDSPPSTRPRPAQGLIPGILNRLFPPPPAPIRRESRSASAAARQKEKAAAADADEPATDAAVKRKIEKQIRQTLGDRVRSVEVRVNGKNVLIVAEATRFWQKRTVRRALETLPVLSGYRARIDLDD